MAAGVSTSGSAVADEVVGATVFASEARRVAEALLDRLSRQLGATRSWVHIPTDRSNELRLLASRGVSDDSHRALYAIPISGPYVESAAARTRAPRMLRADRAESGLERSQIMLSRKGAMALLALPLVASGELVAVLTCALAEAVPAERIEEAMAIVEPYGIAIRVARALDRERVRHAQLDVVRSAALAIAEAPTVEVALKTIVDEARSLVHARYAALGIVADPDLQAPFKPWVQSGMSPEQVAAIGRTPRPLGLLAAVPREGRSIRLRDVNLDARYGGVPAHHPEMNSFLGVPIQGRVRAIGNLYLADKIDADEFSVDDEHAVTLLAQHAGVMVERFRDAERVEREARDGERAKRALAAQASTAQVLAEAPPVQVAAKRVLEAICTSLQWDWGCLWLLEPEANLLRCAELWYRPGLSVAHFEELTRQMTFPPGVGLPGRVWSTGRPEWVHDVIDDPRFLRLGVASREGLHGAFFVPVTTNGRFLGVMEIMSRQVRAPDEDLLMMIASSGAQIGQLIARRRAEDGRERLLASLAAERSWLRAVVERSPVGIVLALGRGAERIVANQRASELLGIDFAPDAGLAQLSGRLLGVDGRPLSDAELPVRRALESGELVSGVELSWRSAGEERALLVNASPIEDGEGRCIGAAMVIEDISSLRELQRLRDEWTSMVAHDLRQPVSTITAAAQLIARGDADPTLHALAERILSGSQRLHKMIADLLDASRLDARRLVLTREETDVGRLIRGTIDGAAAPLAGHSVKADLPPDLPKVSIDPSRIEQVLVNLLGNAARYGRKGGDIEVIAERVDGNIRISVLNEGASIPREQLEGFFARFRRGSARRVAGSGLGLYISRGLVEAHGGRIWAEMDPSGRIAFRFTIPA